MFARRRWVVAGAPQIRPAGLGKCESDQARAKQADAGNGHCKETFGSEFISHGTSPIVSPRSNATTAPLHSKEFSFHTAKFDPG
jgi:hypothetical protein